LLPAAHASQGMEALQVRGIVVGDDPLESSQSSQTGYTTRTAADPFSLPLPNLAAL
jgi:hypothetical protein